MAGTDAAPRHFLYHETSVAVISVTVMVAIVVIFAVISVTVIIATD